LRPSSSDWWSSGAGGSRGAVRFSSLSLVLAASPGSSVSGATCPFACSSSGLASLVVASPGRSPSSAPSGQTSIILAMDVSRSMCLTDIAPSRLQAAKRAAADFIQRQDATTQMGVVAFAGFGQLVQAPTSDTEALLDAVASLTTGRRTAIGSSILTSIDAIAEIDPSVAPAQTDRAARDLVAPGAYVPTSSSCPPTGRTPRTGTRRGPSRRRPGRPICH
jgi:Ca-activated chloride channel family protein